MPKKNKNPTLRMWGKTIKTIKTIKTMKTIKTIKTIKKTIKTIKTMKIKENNKTHKNIKKIFFRTTPHEHLVLDEPKARSRRVTREEDQTEHDTSWTASMSMHRGRMVDIVAEKESRQTCLGDPIIT